ncbi:MAG: zinc-binding dehydrogenase [Vampirovibrionia bacterium]
MKMKAVMFHNPGDIRYSEVEVPNIRPLEVLVKVDTALTCGTDVKTYRRGHPVLIKEVPSGFGHEFSGTVVEVGSEVDKVQVGQRVVAANSAPCNKCFYCRICKPNLCENLDLLNGAYAEYIVVPRHIVESNLIVLPDNVSFEDAAFTEPLAVVLHGIERSDVDVGKTVGVIGIGPIGLMFVKLAKLRGANVIAMGRNPLKLKLAKEFGGADEVVDLTAHSNPIEYIRSLTPEGKGLDVVIEAVGMPEIWEQAISLTRKGGTINLFGGCESGTTITIDTKRLHYDELKLISVFHHTPYFVSKAFRLISNKQLNLKQLISETLPLSQLQTALEKHENGEAIKVAIKPGLDH